MYFYFYYRKVPSIRPWSYLSFILLKQGGLIRVWGIILIDFQQKKIEIEVVTRIRQIFSFYHIKCIFMYKKYWF